MIYQFDPVIYPCRIWVAIDAPFKEITEKFYGLSIDMERIDVKEEECDHYGMTIARTHLVIEKEGEKWIGCFVNIYKSKKLVTKFICHEAVHCADFICEHFGISSRGFDEGEPYAYLVGWIAECIEKVKLNKF